MKKIKLANEAILDFNHTLLVIPDGLVAAAPGDFSKERLARLAQFSPGFADMPFYECGGFREFTTKTGRMAIRVFPGRGCLLAFYEGFGDRSWRDYDNRRPVGPGTFSLADATSRGGGCWFEAVCVSANIDAVQSAEQYRLQDELHNELSMKEELR